MADKTILDFPVVTSSLDDDVIYLVRGVAADRDRHVTKENFLKTIDFPVTFNAEITIRNTTDFLYLYETDGLADERAYDLIGASDHLRLRAKTDADALSSEIVRFFHSGNTVFGDGVDSGFKVDIVGDLRINSPNFEVLTIRRSGDGNATAAFRWENTGTSAYTMYTGIGDSAAPGWGVNISNGDINNSPSIFVHDGSGNITVGATGTVSDNGFKLSVNGTAHFSANVIIGGDSGPDSRLVVLEDTSTTIARFYAEASDTAGDECFIGIGGRNSNGDPQTYATIGAEIIDGTSGSADGAVVLKPVRSSASRDAVWVTPDEELIVGGGGVSSGVGIFQVNGYSDLMGNWDEQITSGGARTETISNMNIGELIWIDYEFTNNTGGNVFVGLQFPASGTYKFNLIRVNPTDPAGGNYVDTSMISYSNGGSSVAGGTLLTTVTLTTTVNTVRWSGYVRRTS
jgi:hypothetical protein